MPLNYIAMTPAERYAAKMAILNTRKDHLIREGANPLHSQGCRLRCLEEIQRIDARIVKLRDAGLEGLLDEAA